MCNAFLQRFPVRSRVWLTCSRSDVREETLAARPAWETVREDHRGNDAQGHRGRGERSAQQSAGLLAVATDAFDERELGGRRGVTGSQASAQCTVGSVSRSGGGIRWDDFHEGHAITKRGPTSLRCLSGPVRPRRRRRCGRCGPERLYGVTPCTPDEPATPGDGSPGMTPADQSRSRPDASPKRRRIVSAKPSSRGATMLPPRTR